MFYFGDAFLGDVGGAENDELGHDATDELEYKKVMKKKEVNES